MAPPGTPASSSSAARLHSTLTDAANPTGGWGYYKGKASRIEPTAWALLALADSGDAAGTLAPHARFLTAAQQPDGWLTEGPGLPVNISFNALVAFTWFALPALAGDDARRALLSALVSSKGIQVATVDPGGQDNSLQGWSWIDQTFSWVEPTGWGLLALKKAREAGVTGAAIAARIDEAERLLVNRVCRDGGWNFGNATVLSQDLRPYVPTTALGLLALQDRPSEPAVVKSLAWLESHWSDEPSAASMSLSLICLGVFGRPFGAVVQRLEQHAGEAIAFANLRGEAMSLYALARRHVTRAFQI